jgi:Flp pilus assembly protein TadG
MTHRRSNHHRRSTIRRSNHHRRSSLSRSERGQVTVMIVGFAFILMLAIAVVVDASAAYLQRSGLDSVADGAALAGTEALDLEAGYAHGFEDPELSRRLAEDAVRAYLEQTGARDRFPGLDYQLRVTDNQVVVEVRAPIDLPLNVPGATGSATIGASGTAELSPGG